MKKAVTIILIITLILAFVGCKKIDNTSSESDLSSEPIISSNKENVVSIEDNTSDITVTSSEQSNNNSSFTENKLSESTLPSKAEPTKETNNTENNSDSLSSNDTNFQSYASENRYIQHSWDVNPDTGEKIEGSDSYLYSNGDVYDNSGDFRYNLYEWVDVAPGN